MSDSTRMTLLRAALVAFGLTFIFGIYTLGIVWPSGWVWGQEPSHYLMMIQVVYAVLGVFLIVAAFDPEANRSLISFTIWSSLAHGGLMFAQALSDPLERGHLYGDAPALVLVGLVLGVLMPRAFASQPSHA